MNDERYEIVKLLGKGRTGGVYEAEDTTLGRKVAMRRFFSQADNIDVSDHIDEFIAIAQNLSALQHPNLLQVFDAGVDEDGAYIIAQLLKGDNLHERLKESSLTPWDVNDLAGQLLDALSTSHSAGFIHGAITPNSVLMSPRARGGYLYVILDMGLSRLAPLIQGSDSVLSMMADPAILAPELFDGSPATEKSDLYMLGHILYMCMAGGHPYAGQPIEECSKLHQQPLPPLLDYAPECPPEFVDWISNLCEIDPINRPGSAVEALNSLPKVRQPADINAAVAASTANLRKTMNTGAVGITPMGESPASTFSGAPATANLGAPTGIHSVKIPVKSESNKKVFIIIGAILVVLIGIIIAASSGGNDKKKTTGKKTNAENKTPAVKVAPRNQKRVSFNEIVGYNSEDEMQPSTSEWKFLSPQVQGVDKGGWKIENRAGSSPSMLSRLSNSNIDDMFHEGWTITYKVNLIEDLHLVGFHISAADNEKWLGGDKSVRFMLLLEKTAKGAKIYELGSNTPVATIDLIASEELDLKIRSRRENKFGKYTVYHKGKKIFSSKLQEGGAHIPSWRGAIVSGALLKTNSKGKWRIKEFVLDASDR